jgi:HD-GYP domain-containing protein (c-di-GMP phosphodiesterase class II)
MRLAQAIFRDGQCLLTSGKPLEPWEIDSLRRHQPDAVIRVGDPLLDDWVEFEDDSHDQEVAFTVTRQIGRIMGTVRNKLGNQTALKGPDIADLQKAVAAAIQYIQENPVNAAMLARFADWTGYFQEHSANVFYLSLLMGNAIRQYVYRERERTSKAKHLSARFGMNLNPLALGCLFHDMGMIPLENIVSKKEPLTDEEKEMIRQHPEAGVDMLPRDFNAVAKMIVRTHHENCAGTGYPQAVPSDSLHIFSRVVRVADAFDAGTSHRVYQEAKSAVRVLWEMSSGPYRNHYDPVIVRILMGLIQPYPIGAKVRLNNGQHAVVVRHNRRCPFHPTVIIAYDEQGNKLKKSQLKKPINLAKNDLYPIGFGAEDLSYLYESPEDEVWGAKKNEPEEPLPGCVYSLCYP